MQLLGIRPEEYETVRANPRHLAVCHGHEGLDVETVVAAYERYVVVEKIGVGAVVAEERAAGADRT